MKSLTLMLLIGLAFVALRTVAARGDNTGMGTRASAPDAPTLSIVTNSGFALTGQVHHIASGVGLRNRGNGTIRLRGAPSDARTVLGILYFGFICDGPCPLDVAVSFQGVTVAGILLATAPQPCWAGETYGAYSADVTPWLSSPINDDYRVEGVPSGRTDGSDPWFSELTLPLAEGASLVVVYAQSNLVPGVVYINEGAVMFSGTVTIDNPVSPPLTERAGAS